LQLGVTNCKWMETRNPTGDGQASSPFAQARSQVLRSGGQDVVFTLCSNQIFLGTTKFGGTKKFGWHCPECPPWLGACVCLRT